MHELSNREQVQKELLIPHCCGKHGFSSLLHRKMRCCSAQSSARLQHGYLQVYQARKKRAGEDKHSRQCWAEFHSSGRAALA